MVNFYHQCTEQVTEDRWKLRTSHVTVNCPEIEALLSKGYTVIDAVVASTPQTSEQGELPATAGNSDYAAALWKELTSDELSVHLLDDVTAVMVTEDRLNAALKAAQRGKDAI